MDEKVDQTGAQSFHRAINILRLVAAGSRQGVRHVDVMQQAGLTRTTSHRILQALQREGLVEQDQGTGRYHLGRESYFIGLAAEDRFGIRNNIQASMARLVEKSADTCLVMVRNGDHAVCIGRAEGTFPIRTYVAQVGDRFPLGIGGGSLAIMATLSDQEIAQIIDANGEQVAVRFPEFTPDFLLKLVAEARETGFVVNPGRYFPESWSIAVAVPNDSGPSEAALSLAGIRSRIDPRIEELVALLRAEARRLSARLAHRPAL